MRLILLALVLAISNYLYGAYFYKNDLEKLSELAQKIAAVQDSCQVLYLGESSNFTTHGADLDKRSISEFTDEYYPNIKFKSVNQKAAHAGTFKEILRQISHNTEIETVVLTCNLRSFGPDWIYSGAESMLNYKVALLNGDKSPLLNRFLLSFRGPKDEQQIVSKIQKRAVWYKSYNKDYLPVSNLKQWRKLVAKTYGTSAKLALADDYIKAYAYQIIENNPRVKDFDEIVQIAKQRGWNLIFNLMAENTQKANELIGEPLVKLMEENAQFLIDRYESKGVSIANNLNLVGDHQYIDQDWTSEHYAEIGRKAIALNLANTLKRYYGNEYSLVKYKAIKKQCQFFHNCEMDKTWGQMSSLTEEMAYSGKHSSVCWAEKPYSLTFERPFNSIADSCKNQVNVSFQLYAPELEDGCMLIFQLSGNVELYWKPTGLNQIVRASNSWQKVVQRFSIPIDRQAAEIVKIFVVNSNDSKVYIDDLSVSFE